MTGSNQPSFNRRRPDNVKVKRPAQFFFAQIAYNPLKSPGSVGKNRVKIVSGARPGDARALRAPVRGHDARSEL